MAVTPATLPAELPPELPPTISRPRRARTGGLSRRLGGPRVRIGEEQRDQGYFYRLVDVANDRVLRSHEEEEHDRQRCESYQGPSRSAPEACQLRDRQLQGRQKP